MKYPTRFLTVHNFSMLLQSLRCLVTTILLLIVTDVYSASTNISQHVNAQYVEPQVCAECHQSEYKKWQESHHALAMQKANANTVLGDFNNSKFTYNEITSTFFKRDGKFYVRTDGADGELHDYEISYTFGITPLQQYLIKFPGGRLQSLTIAWDINEKRWFHLYGDQKIDHNDPLHWTKVYQNWNWMCGECHTTNYKKNYDPDTDTYQTTFSEINVGCQACHGPGSEHATWAGRRASGEVEKIDNYGLTIDLKEVVSKEQIGVCASCHSRRTRMSYDHQPGQPLLDAYIPATLDEGLYHPDGQIQDEVYVYGSFMQSKMHKAGVGCNDCHNSHSLKLKKTGNDLCTQCHNAKPPARFKGLIAKEYDTSNHHFHLSDSAGAQCVNCHMPEKNFMEVDPRRDHSFRIPRPDLSISLNTPNACVNCHKGETDRWALDNVKKWYGAGSQKQKHYGEVLHDARLNRQGIEKDLVILALNTELSGIVRATATKLLSNYPANLEIMQRMVDLAYDDNALIRQAAIGYFERLPMEQRFPSIIGLLDDPIAAVRMEVARVLADAPPERFNDKQSQLFRVAIKEYYDAQLTLADTPAGQLNLAVLKNKQSDLVGVEKHYNRALKLDPYFMPARFNLSNHYNAIGDNKLAVQMLRDGIVLMPDSGELYYSLGLLFSEMDQLEDAADMLGKAVDFFPERVRVRYNYALTLQHLGRMFEASNELHRAHQLDQNNPDIVYALTIFHVQLKQWQKALPYAQRLVELVPKGQGPQLMLQDIKMQVSKK